MSDLQAFGRKATKFGRHTWAALPKTARKVLRAPVRIAVQGVRSSVEPHRASVPFLGLVSVIVPTYNVEEFLEECLQSLVDQKYPHIEIIVVDDGSTDGSGRIADSFAVMDSRITVIRKPNGGLGAARNTGLEYVTGDFVAFVDSDDIVPADAYQTMVTSLNETGSDFVVGSFHRFNSQRRWLPATPARVHSRNRLGLKIHEYPTILLDLFSWNKMFRTEFWRESVAKFPEGILYEDKQPMTAAYMKASSFDVLEESVYNWRIRENGTSITQQKHSMRDLVDRLHVASSLSDLLEEDGTPDLRDFMFHVLFHVDLPVYYRNVPRADDEYWMTLVEGVRKLWPKVSESARSLIGVHETVMAHLVYEDAKDDLGIVLADRENNGSTFRVENTSPARVSLHYQDGLSSTIPESLLLFGQANLQTRVELTSYDWTQGSTLEVGGIAYLRGFSSEDWETTVSLRARDSGGDRVVTIPVLIDEHSASKETPSDAMNLYSSSRFKATIETAKLLSWSDVAEWILEVEVTAGPYTDVSTFKKRSTLGSAGDLDIGPLVDGARLLGSFGPLNGLSLRKHVPQIIAESIEYRNRVLRVQIRSTATTPITELSVECRGAGRATVPVNRSMEPDVYLAEIAVPELPRRVPAAKAHTWSISVVTEDQQRLDVEWSRAGRELWEDAAGNNIIRTTDAGRLQLRERRWQFTVDNVFMSADGQSLAVSVSGGFSGKPTIRTLTPRLVLATDRMILHPSRTELFPEGNITVHFDIRRTLPDGRVVAPESNTYFLRCLMHTSDSLEDSYWLPVRPSLWSRFPLEIEFGNATTRLSRTPKAGALAVKISPPLSQQERGRRHQELLITERHAYVPVDAGRERVLFMSFNGNVVGDSGLALFRAMSEKYPTREYYWGVKDNSVLTPEGTSPVVVNTSQWHSLLNTAEILVNNSNFPHYFRKNPHQFYVQTWHGTPLKKIANDVPAGALSLSYRQLMKREATEYWDVLLAQNKFASQVLPKAFDFSGYVVNQGYPRNDLLKEGISKDRKAAARKALGIADTSKVVLYAPTWRDNVRNAANRYDFINFLDTEEFNASIGSEYTLLVRGHQNTANQRHTAGDSSFFDVTSYPDINELFLISDVLITDYSSVMFDFCVTNKPILFLAPDLMEYANSVRGFYMEFQEIVPGPILESTSQVVECLRDLESVKLRTRDAYTAFVKRFAPLDDGGASQRVLEELDELYARHTAKISPIVESTQEI